MGIIIFITVVVFGISMYDYLISRKWQQVTSNLRNEVVFEERNKNYGAYKIRRDYDRNLILIMVGLIASFGIGYGAVSFLSEDIVLPREVIIPEDEELIKPDEILIPFTIKPKQVEVIEPAKAKGDVVENLPPTIVDEVTSSQVKSQEELEQTQSGSTTIAGNGSGFGTVETSSNGNGSFTDVVEKDVIVDIAQFEAEFPGGINALHKYLSSKLVYPQSAIANNKQGKVYLRFVVGKQGEIESVDLTKGIAGCSECDKEAMRVVKGMPKWKPARHNGKVVRSYFNLPITFTLK